MSSLGTGNWSGTNAADGIGANAVFVASANQSLVRRDAVSRDVMVNPTAQNVPVVYPPVRQASGYNISDEWMMYSTAFNGAGGTSNPGGQLYDRLGNHNDSTGVSGAY